MTGVLGWLVLLGVLVLLIGVPLVLGRLLADRDRVLEHDERSALEAEALTLMVGQPVDEVSSAEASTAASPVDASPVEVSPADGHDSSPM
jgi:hypothetical protein